MDSTNDFLTNTEAITGFAREIKEARFRHVVLLGMGGSSLCPEVARETFGSAPGWPELFVLDNTDPAAIAEIESQIDFKRTLFLVASKSGTTTETLSFYRYFHARMVEQGIDPAGRHFVAITDPGNTPGGRGTQPVLLRIFENPADIGGATPQFPILACFPWRSSEWTSERCSIRLCKCARVAGRPFPQTPIPASALGTILGINARRGRDKVTLVLSPSVGRFGARAEQLIAESTGKKREPG